MEPESCLHCAAPVGRLKSFFCTDKCRRAHKKLGFSVPQAACKWCSNVFNKTKSNHMFCSKACATKHYKSNNVDRERASKRAYLLQSKYGLTPEQWEEIFNRQGRRCAICKEAAADQWAVDHNHVTGAVRGILCSTCNLGLGYFKDNVENLHEAAVYLLSERSILQELMGQ